jgi:hypothetical protein
VDAYTSWVARKSRSGFFYALIVPQYLRHVEQTMPDCQCLRDRSSRTTCWTNGCSSRQESLGKLDDGAFCEPRTGVTLGLMPLLPESFASILETDRAAALAATVIVGKHHADVLQWVWGMIGAGVAAEPRKPRQPRKANGAARKANGVGRKPPGGKVAYSDRRLAARDEADVNLLAAMRSKPGAGPLEWAVAIGRSKSSVLSYLHRLEEAGAVEHSDGVWSLATEPVAREPTPKQRWVAPVRGADRAVHAHLTAS